MVPYVGEESFRSPVWHCSGCLLVDVRSRSVGLLAWVKNGSGGRNNYEVLLAWFLECTGFLAEVCSKVLLDDPWSGIQKDKICLAIPFMLYGSHINNCNMIFLLDI